MSSEENNKSTENTKESPEQKNETTEQVSEQTEKVINNSVKMASNFLASILKLKEEKPKLFYGAVGGFALLILVVMFSGGSSSTISAPPEKNLVIGQRYVLESSNAYDKAATVRLVAVPGTLAAYDDTEEDDRMGDCKHMPNGTPITILGFQDAYGKQNTFANIQIETEGACKGRTAWTLSINIK